WPSRRGGCSTPFGITEVGIDVVQGALRLRVVVLNAFRHHRGGHWGPVDAHLRCSAVLNAFRHHRGGHLSGLIILSHHSVVLNAFRHHRGGHSRGAYAFQVAGGA